MKYKWFFAILIFLLSFSLSAEMLVDEDIGFQVEVPDTWSTFDDEGILMAMDPDEMAAVFLVLVLSEEFDDAVGEIESTLGAIMEEIELSDDPEELELNGLPGMMVFGTGAVEGEPVLWGVVVVYNEETDIALFVITFAIAETFDEYEEVLLDILSSVSAVDPGY